MTIRRADGNVYVLGQGLTATGNAVQIRGGEYLFIVSGSVGAATTFRLEQLNPTGVWVTVQVFTASLVSFPAAQIPTPQTGIDLPAGSVRLAIIGGTATSINAWLLGLS